MAYSTPEPLCFPPIAGHTVRADFQGGALSSDFGALLLRGIDRQIGLTERLAAAVRDKRHPSYIAHPLRDLLAQRIYQIASGYADGNDANSLRCDPLFKLGVARLPVAPEQDLASAPTFSRLEHRVDRQDLYRFARALMDHFIAGYPEPPAAIVLDLDHSDDPTHGQQELAFYHHYYRSYGYLPLFIFEGTSHALVTAGLRPGDSPYRGGTCHDPGAGPHRSPSPMAGDPYPCAWRPPFRHPLDAREDCPTASDRFRLRLGR